MSQHVFRAYDVRGVVDKDFDAAWVEQLGRACGAYMLEQDIRDIVLGYDCRHSSLEYHDALARGLMATGVHVVSVGMVPTPVLYFAIKHLRRRGGVMITASHNPPQYNGFKIWAGESTIYGDALQEVRRLMEAGVFPEGQGLFSQHGIVPSYLDAVCERMPFTRPLRVVVDGGNGAGGLICCQLLERLGAQVVPIFCDPDGDFPNHHPDPVVEDNMRVLMQRVVAEHADFGVGLDGDADRLGVVDAAGRLLNGDELLSIYATELLRRKAGALVIGDVKCSQRLFDDIVAKGGQALMSMTGHSLIKAKIREHGAELAGEMSGHMFFVDGWFGFDDAVYGAARLYCLLAASTTPLTAMPAWPPACSTREINIACPDAIKASIVAKAQHHFACSYPVNTLDGVRVQFGDGWGLVRASNTQPALVCRFEAATPERLRAIQDTMLSPVRSWIDTESEEDGA